MASGKRIQKIRYAVVGLGHIAQVAVLPAFAHAARNSVLTALISSDPAKLKYLGHRYSVKRTYSYEQYEECLRSDAIDAVYIALPNNMHAEYSVRAANAGVHVLCEKPMAVMERECQSMILAARRHNIKLMIAYRLHFEEIDEMTAAVIRFPKDRIASFTTSFGAADVASYEIIGTKGKLRVDPAYEYEMALKHSLTIDGKTTSRTFPRRDQFAPELLYFSDCIINNVEPEPSGEEGLADVRVVRALYRSAETGKPVKLVPARLKKRPRLKQEKRRPPVAKPRLIHAENGVRLTYTREE